MITLPLLLQEICHSEIRERAMEINIRKAVTNDYNLLCGLFDELDALHRNELPHIFQKPGGSVREQDYYSGLIADENVGLFVAETGGKLAGFVHAIVRDTPVIPVFVPRRYAVVDSIVVRSGFQNRGIGRMLMGEMEEWAMTKGATSIELNVYEFNETAISFYEKLGYRTYSRRMSMELKVDKAGNHP
jgi:ribosomal protein S18 acetylase RimI-like enzyme